MKRLQKTDRVVLPYIPRLGEFGWWATAIILVLSATPLSAAQVRVRQGQLVQVKLHDVLTTDNKEKDDGIDFDVVEDVMVSGHVVIAKGAVARGKVIKVKTGGKKMKDASITFRIVSVRAVDNQEIPLRAKATKAKKSGPKENDFEESSRIPGYAARVVGAEKGREYGVYTDTDAIVNAPEAAAAPPPTAVAPAPPNQAAPQAPPVPQTTPPAPSPMVGAEPAFVEFNSNPAGADIMIDGSFVGNTPSTLRVIPGQHVIELRSAGYRVWTRTLMVDPGSHPSVRGTLEKE